MTSAGNRAAEKEKFERGLAYIVAHWMPSDTSSLDEALAQCRDKAAIAHTAGRTNSGCLYEALAEVYRLYIRIVAEEKDTALNAWCFGTVNTSPKTNPVLALVKLSRLAARADGTIDDKKSSKYAQALRYAIIRKIAPDALVDFMVRTKGGMEARAGHFRDKFPKQKGRAGTAWKAPRIVFDEKARETFLNADFIERGQTFLMAVRVEKGGGLTVLGCLPDGPQTKSDRRRAGLPSTLPDADD
jgi:hypothetical protein